MQLGFFHMDQPMRSYSHSTKLYLAVAYVMGIAFFSRHVREMEFNHPWLLAILCILASLALILKVEGSTDRSHYTFSLVVYGFTFVTLGVSETILVIVVSHTVEWLSKRTPLSIQLLYMAAYLIAAQAAGMIYHWMNHGPSLVTWQDVLGILMGMATFVLVVQLMTGVFLWLTRKENLLKSGTFDFFPLMLNISLLYFGASSAVVWHYNPFAILLFVIPTYLMYSALRVPALKRKTELDSKTGLFNHSYFKKHLEGELARSNRYDRPLSVIIADLDLLRNINNTYGHLAGDEVLIGVAKAIRHAVREYDVVSRFGGEEFAILLPETTLTKAYERAESIRKTIEAMEFIVPTSLTSIRATMSFGVAHRENIGQTPNEIVHNADLALYKSKLGGRNRTCAHTSNPSNDLPHKISESPDWSTGMDYISQKINISSEYRVGYVSK